jgi:hypothetical protein
MTRPALDWIERYNVRSDGRHEGWAVVVIDSKGFLGVVSDYGNYAFHWSSFGDDFRKFLREIDDDYLYGKLMQGRDAKVYDGEATLRGILKRIIELRREGRLTPDRARDEWTLAKDSEINHDRFSDGFSIWYRETQLENANELYETMQDPQCRMFCQKVWPRFVELLKAGQHDPVNRGK